MKNNETIETNNGTLETHSGTLEASEQTSTLVTLEPSNQLSRLVVDPQYSFYNFKYAGYYRIGPPTGYTSFTLSKKPNWFHRMFSKLLLGWEWVDNV